MIETGRRPRWAHWGFDGEERVGPAHVAKWVHFAVLALRAPRWVAP